MSNKLYRYVSKYFILIEASVHLKENGKNRGNKIFATGRTRKQIEMAEATNCKLPCRLFANNDQKTIRR